MTGPLPAPPRQKDPPSCANRAAPPQGARPKPSRLVPAQPLIRSFVPPNALHEPSAMATSHLSEHRPMRSGSLNIQSPSGRSGAFVGPMPVHHRFDGPRSPPSTSDADFFVCLFIRPRDRVRLPLRPRLLMQFRAGRHVACAVQILPPGRLPGWQGLPVQP